MVSFIISILALLSTASALIVERDANTVLSNFKAIDTAVNKLDKDIKSWDGTAAGSLIIQGDESNVERSINDTIKELQTERPFNLNDQTILQNYFTGTIEPDFKAAINILVSRKADFQKAGLGSLVKQDLQRLYNELQALCQAIFGVVASPQPNSACRQTCERLKMLLSNAAASSWSI